MNYSYTILLLFFCMPAFVSDFNHKANINFECMAVVVHKIIVEQKKNSFDIDI